LSAHDFDLTPLDGEDAEELDENTRRFRMISRVAIAGLILVVAIIAECMVMVPADEAVVINRLGDPVRVITKPGLAWKLPAPIETVIKIDLRLRTTSTGLQDVGTRDSLRVLMQTYTAWRVPNDPAHIRQFLRAVRNQPDEAARQLRTYVTAGMHITTSNFNFSDLINTDPKAVKIDAYEQQLQAQIASQVLASYGIQVSQVGVERVTLPPQTLTATVQRMSDERNVVAAQVTAEGARQAAQIQADADRDAREAIAKANQQAAQIQANAEVSAASVYAKAYRADPNLYTTLRSLDTVGKVMGPNVNVVLRTDAAPFRVLSEGPAGGGSVASSAPPPPSRPAPPQRPAAPAPGRK
jgi:membrane protease subunit HflC